LAKAAVMALASSNKIRMTFVGSLFSPSGVQQIAKIRCTGVISHFGDLFPGDASFFIEKNSPLTIWRSWPARSRHDPTILIGEARNNSLRHERAQNCACNASS
jgi:hypothetical protein